MTKKTWGNELKKRVKDHIHFNYFNWSNFHPELDQQSRILKYFDEEMSPEISKNFESMSKLFGFFGRAKVEEMVMNSIGFEDFSSGWQSRWSRQFEEKCHEEGITPKRKVAMLKSNFFIWAKTQVKKECSQSWTGHAPDWVE